LLGQDDLDEDDVADFDGAQTLRQQPGAQMVFCSPGPST